MKIKVLIVEDNPITSQDLKEIIVGNGMEVTGIAKNAKEAEACMSLAEPDILLVDINLKDGDDGIDFVSAMDPHKIPVIYLTANSDKQTVERALKTNPSTFLTKPYDDRDVVIALELAFQNHCQTTLKSEDEERISFIFLKSVNRFEKVFIEDILYLQAEGSYTKFITDKKEYTLSCNLYQTNQRINHTAFLRIHRSFIVNIDNVTGLDNDSIFLGNKNLPISRTYKTEVNRILQRIS